MLDQVKSGTSARIATSRAAPGQPGAGEAVRGRQVAALSGANGTDDDQMSSSGQHPGGRNGQPGGGPDAAPHEGAGAVSVPDRAVRGAIESLLKEAAALRRSDSVPTLAGRGEAAGAAPSQALGAGGGGGTGAVPYNRAAGAYASQASLEKRGTLLRPGAVYSERF